MTYVVESSDSESDDEIAVNSKGEFVDQPIAVNFGDEEEEVEYFGGSGQASSSNNAKEKTESKLASILFQKDISTPTFGSEGGKGTRCY